MKRTAEPDRSAAAFVEGRIGIRVVLVEAAPGLGCDVSWTAVDRHRVSGGPA